MVIFMGCDDIPFSFTVNLISDISVIKLLIVTIVPDYILSQYQSQTAQIASNRGGFHFAGEIKSNRKVCRVRREKGFYKKLQKPWRSLRSLRLISGSLVNLPQD